MQITRQLPRHILTALQAAAQSNRFFSDMAYIDALQSRGLEGAAATENARVMAYVANAVGCSVDQLEIALQMAQPAPDPRDLIMPISRRLHEERERIGLSVQQLACIGGAQPVDQLFFEAGGASPPPAHYLAQLARDAGIDVLYVLTGRREGATGHA